MVVRSFWGDFSLHFTADLAWLSRFGTFYLQHCGLVTGWVVCEFGMFGEQSLVGFVFYIAIKNKFFSQWVVGIVCRDL